MQTMKEIIITPFAAQPQKAMLRFGHFRARCALGRGGFTDDKREGDEKTPLGRFALRRLWLRPDRFNTPKTGLPIAYISQKSGWSDDISAADYNRPITRPSRFRHECLWRYDRLYDAVVELGYNDDPPVKNRGSAIFLHLEKGHFKPTLGCIAVRRATMHHLLKHADLATVLRVDPPKT